MRLKENRRPLAIVTFFMIFNTISIIFIPIGVNAPINNPPTVRITKPAEGENLSGITSVNFTAADQQGVIKERQILIDGKLIRISSYFYIWDTTKEVDGSHTILCRSKDRIFNTINPYL
ncbi:hypothetical protein LCGC14_1929490 [marine sediment metagenome]|uniref:Bacterial Ig-like domain-containing protein n=1 Tax=marine sediment metagenome TaxID=412755 RepID=A0A0F9GBW7_9ZZZZ